MSDPIDHQKIAYIMTRFPKLTETFVLYELLALKKMAIDVEIFPLLRGREKRVHRAALQLSETAHFQPFLSFGILTAQWHSIRDQPQRYFQVLAEILRGTFGSPKLFIAAVVFFPKAVLFASMMERLNVTHIHAHFATNAALCALIIHRLSGIPFSFTAHGSDIHVDRRMLAEKLQAAAYAVTISAYNREVMVKACGEALRNKIHIVHCGVDVDRIEARVDWSINGPLEILCVGSLGEVKGHHYLIEACKLLAVRGIDFNCHLVGDGPLRDRLDKQINEAGLVDQFYLHGGLAQADVVDRLVKADLFVLASVLTKEGRREGIPVALMEAMAAGLPVVASDLSGIPELVEDNITGLLVPPRNSIAIADAIEHYCDDQSLRERMGGCGRKKVVDQFNLAKNSRKLIELFK